MLVEGIFFGQYVPGESLLHRLDPRAKIFCTLVFVLCVLVAGSWLSYGLFTLLPLLLIALAGISWRLVFRALQSFWVILVLTFLLQIFFTPGETIFRAGVLQITREGIHLGGLLFWRLTVIIILSSLLTFTTSPLDLTAAVERLLAPLTRTGLPVRELAMMMVVAMRFLPILWQEALTIRKAQQARGADFNSGRPWERLSKTVPLLVPLFASAFTRAEELAVAMEARCYRVGAKRGRLYPLRFTRWDFFASGVALAVFVVVFVFG